jgi:hypothetical protein
MDSDVTRDDTKFNHGIDRDPIDAYFATSAADDDPEVPLNVRSGNDFFKSNNLIMDRLTWIG